MDSLKTRVSTTGFGKAILTDARNGNLKTLRCTSKYSSTAYLQIFDSATAAAEGATPTLPPIPIPTDGYYESDTPFDYKAGCYICLSSTQATKTLIATDDAWITAEVSQ